jgi:hypothetical protein
MLGAKECLKYSNKLDKNNKIERGTLLQMINTENDKNKPNVMAGGVAVRRTQIPFCCLKLLVVLGLGLSIRVRVRV